MSQAQIPDRPGAKSKCGNVWTTDVHLFTDERLAHARDSEAGKEQTQQERLSTKPLHSELLYRLYQHNLRHSETPGSLMLARWLWLLWHARARAQARGLVGDMMVKML